ncbi:MAG: lipopolysaccharide biosynthesis protein, partial [Parvularculaceae bacterium]|nr:lipopolysaccharide biosynthesis protein [Parvularculaceae bacterium]
MRRSLLNAGWLLGGKGVGGIFSLIYLGLAARTLGVDAFGAFALILAFGQAVAGVVQFQTAEVLIRFGARHLAEERIDRFLRIVSFSALLDLGSAAACAAFAIAAVTFLGGPIGLSAADQLRAAVFGASFLFSLRGTPIGILRLLDRFDVAALSETVLPACRLIAALLCFFFAPTVDGFLAAWACAELVTTVTLWLAALRQLAKRNIEFGALPPGVAGVASENAGLWRFAWFTNFASPITFLWQQAPPLAVGWGAGPAAAGGFRVAQQLAQSLSKPVVSLSRAAFPEFANLAVRHGGGAVVKFSNKLSSLAAIAGLGAVAVVAAFGKQLLSIIFGPEFAFADTLLLLLTIAAAIDFWGFGQEPALLALARPGV